VARRLTDLPETARSLSEGGISYEHAAVIAHSADEVGVDVAPDAEQHLLPAAKQLGPQMLRRATRHIRHWADGGKTVLSNLACICRRHHVKAHEEGWLLMWGEGGELLAIPP
jgi:Domain of unknown function (DUF222)